MAAEYNQDQSTGLTSELDEPRRTTDEVKSDDFGTDQQQPGGGYDGVSEQEPPHHRIHTDDEPLPKPTSEDQFTDAPQSTEGYQQYRDAEPTKFDESPAEAEPRSYETGAGGYADPSSGFPGAPVDRKLEEPGYGYDQNTSEPALASSEPALDSPTPAPKKESFINKLVDKLPGHHHKSADTVDPNTTVQDDTTAASPKKGFVTKLKEKLPGHHTTPTAE